MSSAAEKIKQLASKEPSGWLEEAKARKANQPSDKSIQIAINVLSEIRRQKSINGMSQAKLAEAMNVSPQYVSKLLKGKENFSLPTIDKLEEILGVSLMVIPGFESQHDEKTVSIPLANQNSIAGLNRNNAVEMAGKLINFNTDFTNPTGTNG